MFGESLHGQNLLRAVVLTLHKTQILLELIFQRTQHRRHFLSNLGIKSGQMVDEAADENCCQHFRSLKAFRAESKTDPGYSLSHQSCTVAPFRQWRHLQAGAQLYIRHCWAVFRTCSTGRTAAIAFMGARWGASHEAWSRQTPGSCSFPSKVVTFPPSGNSPPSYLLSLCKSLPLPLGCHLGPLEPLQPDFCRAETGKNCAA